MMIPIPLLAGEPPFTVKGVALGASEAQVKASLPDAMCFAVPTLGTRACSLRKTTYGQAAARVIFSIRDDVVTSISTTISPDDFEVVARALRDSIGIDPQFSTENVVSRAGVTLTNIKITWTRDGQIMRAEKYSGRIDQSVFRLHFVRSREELDAEIQADSARRAKDL